MKKYLTLTLALMCMEIIPATASVLITGFGSSELNPTSTGDLQGTWVGTGSSTPTTFTVTNAPNAAGAGNGIFSTLGTPQVITGNTGQLTLAGNLTGGAPSTNVFELSLFDSSFNELDYTFGWASFAGGATVTANLSSFSGAFNGTVSSWQLLTQGGPTDSSVLSFTFDTLQAGAVPEPATYAMLGLGLGVLGLCLRHRQKVAARI